MPRSHPKGSGDKGKDNPALPNTGSESILPSKPKRISQPSAKARASRTTIQDDSNDVEEGFEFCLSIRANAHSSIVETGINQYPNADSSQDADSDDEYTPRAPKDQNLVKVDDKKGGTRVKGDR
ncbi:hypothetical protein M422DRAFT_244127 [Sphaerobolus stellatus SS14]|nr:hypothetical protein M422DRAFT_244127 [Sphaerobolus stellatus SS14]